jgi:cell division protein FtsB
VSGEQALIAATIITALLGPIVTGVVLHFRTRRVEGAKAEVEVSRLAVDQAHATGGLVLSWALRMEAQVKGLEVDVKELRAEVTRLHAENQALREHNRLLTEQVRGLGGVPVPMPQR